jgi:hypothetical protein
MCIFTLGIYYVVVARRRSRQSEVVILTTKRIVHVNLFQRKGRFPASLGNVEVEVNSYYPGEGIFAGYVRSFNNQLVSSIQTSSGALAISLPQSPSSDNFCKGMQRVCSRRRPIARSTKELYDMLPPKMLGFVIPSQPASSSPQTPPAEVMSMMVDGEAVVQVFEGGQNFAPCCATSPGRICESDARGLRGALSWLSGQFVSVACCFCIVASGENSTWLDIDSKSYLCSFPDSWYCTKCLVWLTQCFTLCMRPLVRSNDLIITTNSLFFASTVTYHENCCKRKSRHLGSSFVCWVPVRQLASHKSAVAASGAHNSGRCCCGLGCTLPDCRGQSRYKLDLYMRNGFSFSFSENAPFKNWLDDVDLMSILAVLGVINVKSALPTRAVGPIERV